jgi:hypothetical protein
MVPDCLRIASVGADCMGTGERARWCLTVCTSLPLGKRHGRRHGTGRHIVGKNFPFVMRQAEERLSGRSPCVSKLWLPWLWQLLSRLSMRSWDQDDPYEMLGAHCLVPGWEICSDRGRMFCL